MSQRRHHQRTVQPASYEVYRPVVLILVNYYMQYGVWKLLSFLLPMVMQVTLVEIGMRRCVGPQRHRRIGFHHNHTDSVNKVSMELWEQVECSYGFSGDSKPFISYPWTVKYEDQVFNN